MNQPVRWTKQAFQEAEDWITRLQDRNPAAAKRAALELVKRTDRLAQFTELGRIGFAIGTRELSMPNWKKVVVYQIIDGAVEILTLRDTRQDSMTAGST